MNALMYAIPLFTAGLLCFVLALVMWHRRDTKGIAYFAGVLIAVAEWTVVSGVSYLMPTLEKQTFVVNFQFIGIVLVPVFWFLFVLEYTGRTEKLKQSYLWLLGIHPVLVNLVVWTDPWHQLFRLDTYLESIGGIQYIHADMGPFFWMHAVYSYSVLLASTYLLWITYMRSHGRYRKQAFLLLIGSGAPWLANSVFILDLAPSIALDLTPFAFVLTAVTSYVALQRFGLFELIPIARERVIEHLRDPVFILDRQDRILDANPAANSAFGIEEEELVGTHITELIPSYPLLITQQNDDMPTLVPLEVLTSNSPATYEVRLHPLDDSSGDLNGGILVLHDVSPEQRARETLASYAERLRVLHVIDQAILAAEQPNNIAKAGMLGLQHLLNYNAALVLTSDEVDGYDFLTVLNLRGPDVDLQGWPQALQHSPMQSGLPLRKLNMNEESISTPLETYLFSRGVVGYLVIPMIISGELIGVMAFEFDKPDAFSSEQLDAALQVTVSLAVTLHNASLRLSLGHELLTRQRTEAALRNSETALRSYADELETQNAELDAFAHTVAHDIKQPLAQLIGYASLLEAEYKVLPEDTLTMCVNAIAGSSRKMNSITEELLLLASVRKLDDIEVQPVDMDEVITEAKLRLERMIVQSAAVIQQPETWPTITAYAPWLEEVWANYISNAIKYGGTPPLIELGWNLEPAFGDQRSANVRFWVRDNGEGMSPEDQSRLFVPFERLEQVRAQGHGLGLSIVERIITRMGGQVGVESTGLPGEGSLFYFTLPLME